MQKGYLLLRTFFNLMELLLQLFVVVVICFHFISHHSRLLFICILGLVVTCLCVFFFYFRLSK